MEAALLEEIPTVSEIRAVETRKPVLWHSNAPWANTGYGQQTALFTPRIRDAGYDLAIYALWGLNGAIWEWDGITVYPGDTHGGNRTLPAVAAHHGGQDCQIITLFDVWPMKIDAFKEMRVASWVPVDHDPIPPAVLHYFLKYGAKAIAMSQFGKRALEDKGVPALYVPHGVDTQVYKPTGGRDRVRKAMGVPEDAYVVGMVANNKGTQPSRKGFPEAFSAFEQLASRHNDVYLYVHSDKRPNDGLDLVLTAEQFGIPEDRIRWAPQFEYLHGMIDGNAMAVLYSALDVLLNPSWGEGFGIPIVEAQACGTPVIVSDWTAMSELCGAGWLVDGQKFYNAGQGSYWLHPSVGSIVDALEEAYETPRDEEKAVTFAAQYDVDRVFKEHWLPTLEKL